MHGWMNIDVISNGFLVEGHFRLDEDGAHDNRNVYFEQLEDALDFIREQAGQVLDAEVEDTDFDPIGDDWWSYNLVEPSDGCD